MAVWTAGVGSADMDRGGKDRGYGPRGYGPDRIWTVTSVRGCLGDEVQQTEGGLYKSSATLTSTVTSDLRTSVLESGVEETSISASSVIRKFESGASNLASVGPSCTYYRAIAPYIDLV